jgi:hypothetical protein
VTSLNLKMHDIVYFMFVIFVLLNECKSSLIVQWLTPDSLLELENKPLKLTRNITSRDDHSTLNWYKYNEKAYVDSLSNRIYRTRNAKTDFQFDLLITEYDTNTHRQLDYYKPVVNYQLQPKIFDLINAESGFSDKKNLIYTFAYLKEFKLEKTLANDGYRFDCSLCLLIAEHEDKYANLTNAIYDFLSNHIQLETGASDTKVERKSSFKTAITSVFKKLTNKRNTDDFKRPIEYWISLEQNTVSPFLSTLMDGLAIHVKHFKILLATNDKKKDYNCNLKLLNQDKSVAYTKTIYESINYVRSGASVLKLSSVCILFCLFNKLV